MVIDIKTVVAGGAGKRHKGTSWGDGNSLCLILGNCHRYNCQEYLSCTLRSMHLIELNYTSLKIFFKNFKGKGEYPRKKAEAVAISLESSHPFLSVLP